MLTDEGLGVVGRCWLLEALRGLALKCANA